MNKKLLCAALLGGLGLAHTASAQEFGLRVDVQPETAAVAPLVDALAEYALSLRESEDGEGR